MVAPIALGLTMAIVGQMLHMFVDVFNSRVQIQMLWLCAGLLVGISQLRPLQTDASAASRESHEALNAIGLVQESETAIPPHIGGVGAS